MPTSRCVDPADATAGSRPRPQPLPPATAGVHGSPPRWRRSWHPSSLVPPAAAEWLFERRLHVLIVAATVATIAMIGGAVALISFAGAPGPADEAATVVETPRPTSDDPDSGNTFAPILPSPGPRSSPATPAPGTPTPSPDDPVVTDPNDPTTDPTTDPAEPPATEDPDDRPVPPGQTNKPDKPGKPGP